LFDAHKNVQLERGVVQWREGQWDERTAR
jgi:hypothetical protein